MKEFFDDELDLFESLPEEMKIFSNEMKNMQKKLKKRKFKDGMTLKEVLSFLTKRELVEIAESSDLDMPKGVNKLFMIEAIEEVLFDDIKEFIVHFTMEHMETLESFANHDFEDIRFNFEIITYLKETYFIFEYLDDDAITFFVPSDILEKTKKLASKHKDLIETNSFVVMLSNLAVDYFGVISIEDLALVFSRDIFQGVPIKDIEQLLFMNLHFTDNARFDGKLVYNNFFDQLADDSFCDEVYEDIKMSDVKEYRIIKEDDLRNLSETGEMNRYSDALVRLIISSEEVNEYAVDEMMVTIKCMTSMGADETEIISMLDISDVHLKKEITDMLSKFALLQPIWVKKGYSRSESESIENNIDDKGKVIPFKRKEDKIYRNDPCPCGSGKKYKKCCMNN